jgi:hypothetical protein
MLKKHTHMSAHRRIKTWLTPSFILGFISRLLWEILPIPCHAPPLPFKFSFNFCLKLRRQPSCLHN